MLHGHHALINVCKHIQNFWRMSVKMNNLLTSSQSSNFTYGAMKPRMSIEVKQIVLSWEHINVFSPPKRKSRKFGMLSLDSLMHSKSHKNLTEMDEEKHKPYLGEEDFSQHHQILKNVSGIVEPGTLLAVMGSSGSGKTTLLNVLTFRNKGNLVIQGEVRINGVKIERAMPGVSCYVQQENLFSPTITVKEQLWFHSQLRMDKGTSKEMRNLRIEEVLQEMGLNKCSNIMVGAPGKTKGISGGEMRRLALALELLTNPPLMFLDEPMSGLDSYMASNVLETLKKISDTGRSIICTIHQPSSEMFEMFDKLLIVCEGRVAYMGAANRASEFFASCRYPMPANYNPAEHFMKVLAVEPGLEEASRKRNEQICDLFKETKHSLHIQERIEAMNTIEDPFLFNQVVAGKQRTYKASWFKQLYTVMWRCTTDTLREPSVFWIKIIQLTLVGLLLGLLFWQQELDQRGVTNLNGILFYMQLQLSFIFALSVLQIYPPELPLVFKEHLDGMYRVDVYFLCKTVIEIPQIIVHTLCYTTVVYWSIGLHRSAEAFFITYACMITICLASLALGAAVALAIKNPKISSPAISLISALLTLVGGFFIHPSSVPIYFKWLKAISWIAYSNEIMIVNQWSRIDSIECEFVHGNVTDDSRTERCFNSGDDIIQFNGYHQDNIGFNFMMIIVLIVCLKLVALLCLFIRSRASYKMGKPSKSF